MPTGRRKKMAGRDERDKTGKPAETTASGPRPHLPHCHSEGSAPRSPLFFSTPPSSRRQPDFDFDVVKTEITASNQFFGAKIQKTASAFDFLEPQSILRS